MKHDKFDDDWPFVPSFSLQLVALGLLLGDKGLRDSIRPHDFDDFAFGAAFEELKSGNGYECLSSILAQCGVYWNPERGHPSKAILDRLKLDAEARRARDTLLDLLDLMEYSGDRNKKEFIMRLRNAQKEIEAKKPVEPLTYPPVPASESKYEETKEMD